MNYLMSVAASIERFLNTVYSSLTMFFQSIHLDERMAFFCEYHEIVCFLLFLGLLIYFAFFDPKKSVSNFESPINITVFLAFLPIYYFLSDRNLNLAPFGLGTISIHPFLLIILGKLYGPMITATFGATEYLIFYITHPNDPLMYSLFFIYAIGGFIHGWILYEHKTSFWRCFLARLLTVTLCNVILIPLVRAGIYTHLAPLSIFIPQTITTNILQIPIQATIGYLCILLIRYIREKFEF